MRSTLLFSFTFLLVLFAAVPLRADQIAIGQLNLGWDSGYQVVSFNNLTDAASGGCQVNGPQYSVCSGVNLDSWTLTLTFTDQNTSGTYSYGLFTSPYVISSNGDVIPPADVSGGPYSGGSTTWEIPLNFGNADEPACPPCDYQLTQVEFSGKISPADQPLLVNGQLLYPVDPQAQFDFDTVWTIPADDYNTLQDPSFFGDPNGMDVVLTGQWAPQQSTVPEGGTLPMCGIGMAVLFIYWKRSIS